MKNEVFLAAAENYRSALQKLDKTTLDFHDYELEFSKITKEFNRVVFEKSISEVPANRKKKDK